MYGGTNNVRLQDYQRAFGTRCAACGQYVEGEVVAALGNTYHQKCFTCARCKYVYSHFVRYVAGY